MTENNFLTRIQGTSIRTRKFILALTTSFLMMLIVGTWLLTMSSDQNRLTARPDDQPSSAFALFENGFFRKEVHYTR